MTSADNETVVALQELLDERQRYEGWMRALDERRASTPEHVYNRVHTDYSLRLERVLQRLSERTEQLQSTVGAMSARVDGLRSRETDRTDARHEAELRAAVGEYSEEEWDRIRGDADRELAEISRERQSAEDELTELNRIIALTQSKSETVAEPTPLAVPAADGVPSAPPTPAIVDTTPVADAPADVPANAPADAPAANADVSPMDVPQFGVPLHGDEEAPSIEEFVTQQRAADSPLAGLEVRREEKNLKCPECSALNYATEWYCERCGGELATF